jgi:hypothetical protein
MLELVICNEVSGFVKSDEVSDPAKNRYVSNTIIISHDPYPTIKASVEDR